MRVIFPDAGHAGVVLEVQGLEDTETPQLTIRGVCMWCATVLFHRDLTGAVRGLTLDPNDVLELTAQDQAIADQHRCATDMEVEAMPPLERG